MLNASEFGRTFHGAIFDVGPHEQLIMLFMNQLSQLRMDSMFRFSVIKSTISPVEVRGGGRGGRVHQGSNKHELTIYIREKTAIRLNKLIMEYTGTAKVDTLLGHKQAVNKCP